VCPALTTAAAAPSRTSSAATRIDARGFLRSTDAGASSIVTTSGASTTITSSADASGCRRSSAPIASLRPTSVTATPE
jgi:hypothetical protein